MSFLEFAVFIVAAYVLYLFLVPLQKRLEWRLYKFFRHHGPKKTTIIDITETMKKEKNDATK
jgi:hypothetical protein